MKRLAAALAFASVLGAGAAFAQTMNAAYNNTVVITYPNGATVRYHFNADNTFGAHTPNGHITGTYVIEGSQICLTPAGGQRACSPYEANRNVGDSWTQTAADGSAIQVRIDAGR